MGRSIRVTGVTRCPECRMLRCICAGNVRPPRSSQLERSPQLASPAPPRKPCSGCGKKSA